MHDEALKKLWQEQRFDAPPPVLDEKQIAAMQRKMKKFDRTILWRDWRENIAAIFIALFFGVMFFTGPALMPRIGCVILVLASAFICWYPMHKKRGVAKTAPDAPVTEALECELEKVEVQIRLLRSILWWYLLPLGVGVLVFYFGMQPQVSSKIGFFICVTAVYAFIYWLNQRAVEKQLVPLKREIEGLLQLGEPISQPEPERKKKMTKGMLFGIMLVALLAGLVAVSKPHKEPRAPGFEDVSAFREDEIARVDGWLQEQVALAQYPGLSVAIVRDGKIAYLGAFGFEDMKARRKATPQTLYQVASVTKAFTASVAVVLHARGVIDLDQPVVKYLPRDVTISTRPEVGARITLRQLASHTSGLPRGIPGPVQSVEGRYQLEPKRLYDQLARIKLEFDPGTKELYSNLGFGLLGHVLERAAGKPFEELLQEVVCDPLHLERTGIANGELHLATGYSSRRPRHEEKHSYRERLASSGGLVATAEDLAKFLAAQMKPGVFSSEMLEQLHTASRLSDGSMARTALGWSIRSNVTAGRILEKNGGRNNCSAWIGFAPQHGVGVAVLANCGGPDVDPIGRWLLERSVPGGHKPIREQGSGPAEVTWQF
jgi:CubicO group peptidase (beta-lactamase class C family)